MDLDSPSSSDSDSETDLCMEDSVKTAFEAMKKKLSANSTKRAGNSAGAHTRIVSKLHRRIYDTFDNDSSETGTSEEDPDEADTTSDQEKARTRPLEFFIDKAPANDTSDVGNDDGGVISFDLSNIDTVDKHSVTHKSKHSNKEEAKKSVNKKKNKKGNRTGLSSRIQTDLQLDNVYVNVDPYHHPKSSKDVSNYIQKHKEPEIMKKSVITDDFEKQDTVATAHVSVRQMKKERRLEREKTKGDKWYNLPATEISDERRHDISILKMRKVLDPKRFYKANDIKEAPKYFQFGRVVEDPTDFYSSRIPKKQRKATIVEELLADSEFRQYNKRKYQEVQEAKRLGKGPYKHMKRLKKKKK